MKTLFSSFLFFLMAIQAYCIPAYPYKILVQALGGMVSVTLCGDESNKYAITDDGYTCLQDKGLWYYAALDSAGNVCASKYQLAVPEFHTADMKQYLSMVSKAIEPKGKSEIHKIVSSVAGKELGGSPVVGERKVLIVLAQFPDCQFVKSKQDFDALFNEKGYSDDGAIGSVRDYYEWASNGKLMIKSDILGIYTTKNNLAYYGGNSRIGDQDKNPFGLFEEVLEYVSSKVNIADYDSDNDGFVDNIHIIYAGHGEEAGASSDAIWAHEMTFSPIDIQGIKIDRYSCSPELRGNKGEGITRIGPPCHEIGHALGAMDFYDTDYANDGSYEGTGKWDVMASGSWNNDGISPSDFNPYVKAYVFKWIDVKMLSGSGLDNEVECVRGDIYRIDNEKDGDYYLMENRQLERFSNSDPGHGLLVFHIGSDIEKQSRNNTINSAFPQQCYVVCASSIYRNPTDSPKSFGTINSAGCTFPGSSENHEFSMNSYPSACDTEWKKSHFIIYNIQEEDDVVSFCYSTVERLFDNVDLVTNDDFESMVLNPNWRRTVKNGSEMWSLKRGLQEQTSVASSYAYNGFGYLSHTNNNTGIMRKTEVSDLSRNIGFLQEESNYGLIFYLRKYSQNESDKDSLHVFCRNLDTGAEHVLKSIADLSSKWQRYEIDIPIRGNVAIVFRSSIESNSTHCLDNVVVYKRENIHDGIRSIGNKTVKSGNLHNVYTIDGVMRDGSSGGDFNLPGINILQTTRGSVKVLRK